MKIALVHELLTMRGGAERVLRILADHFADAPIYTLLYDETKLGEWFPPERVRPSYLQKYAGFSTNHHLYLSKFPEAVEAWDLSEFDLVLSTSSAFVHGIITNGKPKHLSYINSPARYLWDRTHDVLDQSSKGILGPLKRHHLEKTFHKLRTWDAEVAPRPDRLIAASKEVQRRIELYWRRESDVIYPPLDDLWLEKPKTLPVRQAGKNQKPLTDPYYLIVSTLVPYKRIDLAIQACNQLNVPLKIVGEGPARASLEKIAGPAIEFLGYRSHEELKDLYANATATIFPGEEDFGLVPLESMSQGTPVIAYRGGGALETVIEGKTGMFFDTPTAASLSGIMQNVDRTAFDPDNLRAQAQQFSAQTFLAHINRQVEALMH